MLPAMTYYAVPTSLNSFATMDIVTENKILLHSLPSKGLCKHSKTIRSNSSSHKCYSLSSIQATSMQPNHKSSHSEASRDMNMRQKQKGINIEENTSESSEEMINKANWVHRLMEIKTYWRGKLPKESMDPDIVSKRNTNNECDCDEDDSFCVEDYEEENGQGVICDRDSFSKFLVPVSWSDTKLFSKLVLLCNMAYAIPQIKAKDLKRYHGLQFVTSSLEKKGDVTKIKAKLDQDSICVPMDASVASQDDSEKGDDNEQNHQTKDLVSLASMSQQHCGNEDFNGKEDSLHEEANETPQVHESKFAVDVAALTMTIVAAAGTAKDLQLVRSSSCEWFVCDDPKTHTRYFVIQGSYSVASWQANISFEPTTFEDTDVLVHSGIYEAAKGIYEQFMPEIMNHLKRQGENAKFQFTGHSLGGSLSFLVYLMLLTRKVVSPSTLQPVVTFGSPFVLCGGQKLLNELGLDESYIHCVMMHRDIVPRIFSCSFPGHVINVLKRFNGSFGSHPCMIRNKLLYSPLGTIFVLQPNEKTSPPHPLLPAGNGFYALDNSKCGYSSSVLRAFLNQPHPFETLSNPTAYGYGGTILRDHVCNNYLIAVNGVFGEHSNIVARTGKSKKPRKMLKTKMRK